MKPSLLLHVLSSFDCGGVERRTVALMNYFGSRLRHVVVSMTGLCGAMELVDRQVAVTLLPVRKSRNPILMAGRFLNIMETLRPDLVATSNWGAIDAVLACNVRQYCPLVHAEDGFQSDEAQHQKQRRVWFRRAVLRVADRVVVPSLSLWEVATSTWKVARGQLVFIPNGVDVKHYEPSVRVGGLRRELVIGHVGHLRAEKRQDWLIRLCADLHRRRPTRLLIAGHGGERRRLEELARALGYGEHVEFLGPLRDVREGVYHRSDLFLLTSSTEQMPLAVLEAMACGLAVVSTDVGDIRHMVSEPNLPFLGRTIEELRDALEVLSDNPELIRTLGEANRAKCVTRFSLDQMFARYEDLYQTVLNRTF